MFDGIQIVVNVVPVIVVEKPAFLFLQHFDIFSDIVLGEMPLCSVLLQSIQDKIFRCVFYCPFPP